MKKISIVVISMICILLTGCDGTESAPFQVEQSELNDSISKWNNNALTTYQYTYRRTCFCFPEEDIVVTVMDGKITEAAYTPSGTPLTSSAMKWLYTVNGLFAEVQKAIDNEVAFLEVTYDSYFGYPTLISIDRDRMTVDDEITHKILDFQ